MLDNPAWWALNSLQSEFAEGASRAKRYRKGILPFIACVAETEDLPADALDELDVWMEKGEVFYIIGRLPVLPNHWVMEFELPCAQMVLPEKAGGTMQRAIGAAGTSGEQGANGAQGAGGPVRGASGAEGPGGPMGRAKEANTRATKPPPAIELLGEANSAEMYDLISRIQPGYYNIDTRLLGNYYGIRQEGRLVAMAGERMRLTGFTELSAICTDPGYTGLGYAQLLIAHICDIHFREGINSMLHVALSNERAIRLYEHMGFRHRREISFWRCRKG